jgi:hypothetical protein
MTKSKRTRNVKAVSATKSLPKAGDAKKSAQPKSRALQREPESMSTPNNQGPATPPMPVPMA